MLILKLQTIITSEENNIAEKARRTGWQYFPNVKVTKIEKLNNASDIFAEMMDIDHFISLEDSPLQSFLHRNDEVYLTKETMNRIAQSKDANVLQNYKVVLLTVTLENQRPFDDVIKEQILSEENKHLSYKSLFEETITILTEGEVYLINDKGATIEKIN